MDNLLGFGRFHHFQIWVVQTVVAILGKEVQPVVYSSKRKTKFDDIPLQIIFGNFDYILLCIIFGELLFN
jgi:hypothetical protein